MFEQLRLKCMKILKKKKWNLATKPLLLCRKIIFHKSNQFRKKNIPPYCNNNSIVLACSRQINLILDVNLSSVALWLNAEKQINEI